MATKTLGIKFEIAGVKEAQTGLDNLRKNLNASLQQNKQAVKESLGLNKSVRRQMEQSDPDDFVDNYQRTVAAIRNKQYRQAVDIYARPRINRTIGGYFEGIGSAAGERTFGKLDDLFRKLTGREEHRETVDLSQRTIDRIGESVALNLTGKKKGQSQRDRNKKQPKAILQQENLAQKLLDRALMPLKTIQYSFYEGIGSFFGTQFAEGLSGILESELDFSMNRKGQVSGKAISYTATNGIEQFKQDIAGVGNNYNDLRYAVEDKNVEQISQKFDTLIKSVTKSITSIGDSYLRGFRKGSVQLEALRKMEGEINAQNNQAPDLTGKDKVIYTVSGFAGEKGQRGEYLAKQIQPYVNERTEVIGIANEFTDVLAPADKNAVMWGISALANLAKINLKGFNPDAVKLAAKVVNTISKNPDVQVDMLGHSAGGFVVEEAQEILNQLGLGDKVSAKTVGTPNMAGNLDNPNVTKIMGDGDFRIKPLEETLEYVGAAKPTDNVVKGVKDHFFDDYLASDEFLAEAFGDSLDKDKVAAIRKKQQKFQGKLIELETLYSRYISAIYQDLDDLGEELSVAPDRLIAKSRRGKLRDRGGKEVQRKLDNKDFREIKLKDGVETAVLVSGGFSGARGRSGAKFAKDANALVDDPTTQFVGVRNPFTDILEPDDVRNPDTQKMMPKIEKLFWETHELGYNPDAVEIAAQVIDLLNKNPNLKVKVGGFSGGGYVAEDVMELLKSHGTDMSRVDVAAIGTPDLPGGIKNRGFQKILGEADPVVAANQLKAINEEVKKIIGIDIFPQLMSKLQNVEGIESHDLEDYIANSQEVQNLFYSHIPDSQELLGNYSQIKEFQSQVGDLHSETESLSNELQSVEGLSDEERNANSAVRTARLNAIHQQQIRLLKQIHALAKRSQEIGGGKFFAQERETATLELEDAGVIVDPIKVADGRGARANARQSSYDDLPEGLRGFPHERPVQEDVPNDDPWAETQKQEQQVIQQRNKNLAQQYKKYLQNITKQTQDGAAIKSQVIARDFASQNSTQQKEFLTFIRREFTAKAKAYRQSIKAGQLEVAKEQGENLLYLAASIKSLYKELANFDELDPEVQSTFKSYSGYISSVENEVLEGTGGKGRIDRGLPNIFEAEIDKTTEDGENVSEGFVNGVLENLIDAHEAGKQLVDAVDEGIREQGEIQSPSRLAKRLGRWFSQGFGLGMAAENMEDKGRQVVDNAKKGVKQQLRKSRINLLRSLFDFGKQGINSGIQATPGASNQFKSIFKQVKNFLGVEISELSEDIKEEFAEEILDLQGELLDLEDNLSSENIRSGLISTFRKIFDFGRETISQQSVPEASAKVKEVGDRLKEEAQELRDGVEKEFANELTDLEDFVTQHQDKFLADNIEKYLDAAGAGIIKKIGSLVFDASQSDGFNEVLDNVASLIGKVVRLVVTFKLLKVGLDALGLGKFIDAFTNLPEKALDAAIGVESLDNRIVQMSGSAIDGARNLDFISEAADRLNRNLTNAKENFSQVLRSTRDTALEGFQTENIYTAFAATAKANALSAADEQGLFRSVRSMIGKGILQSEEVRGEIGERLGDFEQSLAEAYGVSRPQLNQMISNREVVATEALPKVAAVLRAKNDIAGDLNTGAAAAQRADNAVSSFHESVGNALLPLQKFGNNFLAGFFNKSASYINLAKGLVHGFFIALFINLLRLEIFGQSIQKMLLGLIKLLWTMKGALGIFLAEVLLVAAAWKVWENVLNQLSDRFFPKINKEIDQLTRGMKAYRQAIDEAKGAQSDLNNSPLQLAEGIKLPDNKLGNGVKNIIGSDYLNLDSLVREPINKALSNKWGRVAIKHAVNSFIPGGGAISPFIGNKITTAREVKEQQLKIDNSRLALKGNELYSQSQGAFDAVGEITKYQTQIDELESAKFKLLPGDADGLKTILKQQKEIGKEQDKQVRIATNYQQTLTTSINVYKSRLEDVEQRFLRGEIDESTYKSERNNLQGLLGDTEKILKGLNNELSAVPKNLTAFQRRLRNSNERLDGFLATSDRSLQTQRAAIIEAGIADGAGTQTIQIELEEAQQQDLSRRIEFIKGEIANLESDLESPELAAGARRIRQQLDENNIELNETSLQRIIDETTVKADRDAAQGLLDKLRRETQLSGFTEQLAQSLQQNLNALIDYQRTIDDYFFNLNQQIKEAQIEVLRVVNQIIQTQIKNKLQSALSPNANSFVNGLISSTQSMLDQAASYADRILGQRSARNQLAGQKRSLQYELNDFARNVRGAGDALVEFQNKVRGKASKPAPNSSENRSAESFSPQNAFAQKTVDIAQRLGIDPEALMTIMLFESAGTLSPKIQGANVPGQGRGRGLIQFMPATARALGTSDAALAKMTDIDQLDYVEKYFAQFANFGAGKLENLYAAVLAGNPLKVNASDGYVTARIGAQKMQQQYSAQARSLLGKSDILAVPSLPPVSSGSLPAPPPIAQAEQIKNQLEDKQEQKLDLEDSLIANQEKEALEIAIANYQKSERQKVDFNITDSQFGLDKLIDAGKDLAQQYDFSTADGEAAKALRSFNTAFSDRGLQISREIIKYVDEINAINDLILTAPSGIKMLRSAGRDDEADILTEQLTNAKLLLDPYQKILKGLTAEYAKNTEAAKTGLAYVNAQNALKIQQEKLNRRSLLLNQQATIAEQRGTLEARRKLKVHQEDLRLALRINELRQQYAPGEYLDSLIKGERRQSQVNTENINYDSQIAELDLEKKLLDYQSGIGDKKGSLLSRFGINFGAEKVKKENAIAQENLRFERELVQLRKEYQDRPEELEKLSRAATELNRVSLAQIENQFRTLGQSIEESFGSSISGFFEQFTTNFFDGKLERDRSLLQERLSYAEELNQLNDQYKDEPGKLAHLKNRARELNEQKLDKIKGEFNIFGRAVDLAKQALLEFVKQLAKLAAQQAAAKFISSIIGGALGGAGGGGVSAVGNDFGSGAGVSAFIADEGATVGDDIKSRKIGDRSTNILRRIFPGVASAWDAEGKDAQLGVFHVGEELLSRKTGEAGRYQALKARFGFNPLEKIGVFADGGTVRFDANANALAGFPTLASPTFDLSQLEGRGQRAEGRSNTLNLTQIIQTPDADSFGLNAAQRNQDLMESFVRGF